MTPQERIAAIKAREQAATPGPWKRGFPLYACRLDHTHRQADCVYRLQDWADEDDATSAVYQSNIPEAFEKYDRESAVVAGMWDYEEGGIKRPEDATFIAAARSDIPYLLDRVERLEAALRDIEWRGDALSIRAANSLADIARAALSGEPE